MKQKETGYKQFVIVSVARGVCHAGAVVIPLGRND